MRPMGQPTLGPEHVQRVLDHLRILLARCNGNQSAVARELKISQAAVNSLLLKKTRPSFRTAEKIAEKLRVPVWSMLGAPAPTGPTPQSHPTLMAALALIGDRVPADVKERVLAAAGYLPDLAESTWLAILLDHAHGAPAPSSHDAPTRTMEIPIVPKKPA